MYWELAGLKSGLQAEEVAAWVGVGGAAWLGAGELPEQTDFEVPVRPPQLSRTWHPASSVAASALLFFCPFPGSSPASSSRPGLPALVLGVCHCYLLSSTLPSGS